MSKQNDARKTLQNELDRVSTSLVRSDNKLGELRMHLADARAGVCPACGQGTAHLDTHEEYTAELLVKITDEEKYHDELFASSDELTKALTEFSIESEEEDTFYNDLESALEHKHNLDALETSLVEKISEQNPYVEQIESLRETGIQEIDFEVINDLTFLKEHQEFLYKLLTSKDSFIRKRIIDQNIA